AGAFLDNFFEGDEDGGTNEQDVSACHSSKFLWGVFAAALGRHVGYGAFQNLEQRLLHSFTGDVTRDGGVLVLLGDFVDLVDIDDALLGLLYVAVGSLQQLQDNVFDVFTDVACLGEGGGIDDSER